MGKVEKKELAEKILSAIGGEENIEYVTHCMTRLRLNVKDVGLVEEETINQIPGVIGSQWQADQYQIIIGPSVGEVYKHIKKEGTTSEENNSGPDSQEKKKVSFTAIINGISGSLIPLLPLMIGAGMLKVLLILGTMTGLLKETMPTYEVLTFAADAGFYFLPVFLGATAANKFKANMGLGMLLGAILIHPTMVANVADGKAMSIFGLPIYGASYASSIFPILMAVFVMSYVEQFFKKISPEAIKTILVPLMTILVMLPLTLCLIGPAGSFLGIYLAEGIMWLYNTTGFLGIAALAGLYPLLVITGMHGAFVPYMFQSFATFGFEPIVCIAAVLSNVNQGAAALAVSFKTKNKNLKSVAAPSAITAIIGGVTEPAMFGVNLRFKTPLYASMIGSFLGGAFAGLMKVYAYAFGGSAGIFGLTGFVGPENSNLIYAIIALVIGLVATFVITLIIYKDTAE